MSNIITSTLRFAAQASSMAAASIALYCYAFNIVDASGYAIDGAATTIVVLASLFGYFTADSVIRD